MKIEILYTISYNNIGNPLYLTQLIVSSISIILIAFPVNTWNLVCVQLCQDRPWKVVINRY